MKRTFTQKVKHVPACAADSFEALLKLSLGKQPIGEATPIEANRRARTSAAMIGLAISMGAAGLLLPQQGEDAMAVEPIAAEPNLPIPPLDPSTSVSPAPTEANVDFAPTPQPVAEREVPPTETPGNSFQSYEVQPAAIAASNKIQPNAEVRVEQTLKIPPVNGIEANETVKTLSKSYGVEPTPAQASASVLALEQQKTDKSVTVPGNVNDLLKARQDVALNSLKEKRDRLNDSLAELRSEESTYLSKLVTVPTEGRSANEALPTVTLPSEVLKPDEPPTLSSPQSGGSVLSSSVVIPVPTPEIAATPRIEATTAERLNSSVVIPVPTPEIAATPRREPMTAERLNSSVVIPVPTPEMAATPRIEPEAATAFNGETAPVATSATTAKPQEPQPVLMETVELERPTSLYQVKPGDTVDAIARRYGLSRAELVRTNGLNNPNRLNINQQLKIPQAPAAGAEAATVTLLPGISAQTSPSAGQESRGVGAPTLAVPPVPNRVTPIVPIQPQPAPTRVLAQATEDEAQATAAEVAAEPSQSTDSERNPYIDRLRQDILKLRQEMRENRESTQANEPKDIVVPTASGSDKAPITIGTNPDSPDRENETLEAKPERRQQPSARWSSIEIEVPPPERVSPSQQRDLLATVPAPVEDYNPSLRPQVGDRVSPDLPSLDDPDRYLPGSPTEFNGYMWPTKGVITSGYGRRWGRMHKGIDIAASVGTPIFAAAPGVIVSAGWNSGGYGNLVEIQHPDGSLTLYAHNNRILVRRGQEVAQGQQISEMGSTGRSTGPHLHFEVHPSGRGAVNPMAYLPSRR